MIHWMLFAFVGGALLNLMPCVFPVLGIKVLGFVEQAGHDPRAVRRHGWIFTLGVLVSFALLAGMLDVLRAGGERLGWGFQLQSPGFVFALTVVFLAFALNLSGVFEFGLSATTASNAFANRRDALGTFLSGVLATVVATPCSAPFLAPALGAALSLPRLNSFIVFMAMGLGLSLPYLLFSCFPSLLARLPRPGVWMQSFKEIMAFPMYASVAFLIWVLAGQLQPNALLACLLSLVLVALACRFYGRAQRLRAGTWSARWRTVAAAVVLLSGAALGFPGSQPPSEIVWEKWSTDRVQALVAEGRPIYVDFTARWCATCQANKKLVFASDDVRRYFAGHHVAALIGDWTNADPLITTELERWHRSAVPFNLVYTAGHTAPKLLPEVLTPSIVLEAFHAP